MWFRTTRAWPPVAPVLRRGERRRSKPGVETEEVMIIAFALALVGVVVLGTLEIVAAHAR
jgi:hypothetical protein